MLQGRQAQQELLQRKRKKQAAESEKPVFDIAQYLFAEQLAFVNDPHPFSTALCSRRAGKTVACASDLIDTCLKNPDTVSAYITLSRKNTKRIVWPILKQINRDFGLGGKFNNTDLTITFPNDSQIQLSGAKDSEETEKLRGLPFKKVYIDESQSFRAHIRELIDDILAPALMDYNGVLRLIGTPGPVPTGFFFESCRSKEFTHHEWSFFNNPFIAQKSGKTHQQLLDRELKRRGVTINHPSIQREWCGKWVLDSDALLLHWSETKNDYTTMPPGAYTYTMGVDIGFEDSDALCVLAASDATHCVYLVEEVIVAKADITSLMQNIQYLRNRYNVSKIVMDTGGLGRKISEELTRRHHIPLISAEKTRKMENMALLDDALRTGHFKARVNSRFAEESMLVEIDREKSTSERIVVSDRFHSDILDSALYAFRETMAWANSQEPDKPKWGTKEWFAAQVDEMERQEIERLESAEGASGRGEGNSGGWW